MIENRLTKDEVMMAMLKLALEYNSQIIHYATLYAGTFGDMKPHNQKKIMKAFRDLNDEYYKKLDVLMSHIEES